ncbi:transposase [Pontibacter sp. SGAir0037]|uniref:transposase n=1 Tax=Pontibacter sp. SGAir0037 TaxID=2571030 RepID=UPI0010CD6341|nr:transposase [Pontibacter sp. SGAir0037]QCR21646.1 hypothetical protein C1N53_04340 [Pontibacter sp. SGAir0037]
MQGRKTFEDERELRFSLSAHVPEHNFYRRLKDRLYLSFLYELTAPYYGRCGQQSIDPVVFFKLCLVAHLENIASDRRLIEHYSLRLDLLYFTQLPVRRVPALALDPLPDHPLGLQGLPPEDQLLWQTAREENCHHLLPRRVRTYDLPRA